MTQEYTLRCSLCGTESEGMTSVQELAQAKHGQGVHICEACKAKVQFESEQKFK
jgi:predicted SprT family Zn-dependent metalloprotease